MYQNIVETLFSLFQNWLGQSYYSETYVKRVKCIEKGPIYFYGNVYISGRATKSHVWHFTTYKARDTHNIVQGDNMG